MATPTSTLPRPDEDQDEKYSPYNREGGVASQAADDQRSAAEREANPSAFPEAQDEINQLNGLYERSAGGKKQAGKVTGRLRKSSPAVALVTLIFGAGLGFSAFFSPSLLLIHVKEIMVDKFNIGVTSAEARTTRVINAQIDEATTGYCGQRVTLRCKFSTMSKVQVQNFADAGIGVNPSQPNLAFDRTKPTSYVFKGQTITPSQFAALARDDPEFRDALRKAYNPKFAGFWGKAWGRTSGLLGLSKAKVDLAGEDDAERARKLQSFAQVGDPDATTPKTAADFDDDPECNGNTACQEDKANRANQAIAGIDESANDDPSRRLSGALSGAAGEGLTNTVKATGVLDTYCGAYATVRAIGYAGKTIRAVQLARYAMAFYNVTDELVATGNVEPETMAFMAGILTEVTYDVGSTTREIIRGSATDSLGFKYAQFGDTTASNRSMNIASRFIAGGGFAGDLIRISDAIAAGFPGGRETAAGTCGFLANPFVQAGSVVAGLALLAVPGVNVAKVAVQGAASVTASIGLAVLPYLLADIVAGTVTEGIKGEEAGNAIASGSEGMMSDRLAQFSGNGLMSKEDALAYLAEHNSTIARYAEDERRTRSPLDATSQYSFLGNVVSSMIPNVMSLNSAPGILGSFGSLLSKSVSSIIPRTQALADEQLRATLDACQDEESRSAGYATGLFCNPLRGIPKQYLNKSPITVITELIRDGYLTQDEKPTELYTNFVRDCIENPNPPGYNKDADTGWFNVDSARECMVTGSNANIYLSYQDSLIADGLAGEDDLSISNSATTKQELAKKIVAKNKVTYLEIPGFDPRPRLEDIANGSVDADSLECGININILRAIDALTDVHAIRITSLNRKCVNEVIGGNYGSRHYAGNGSGIDIDQVDGIKINGRNGPSISLINIISPIISEAAVSQSSFSRIGQLGCPGAKEPPALEGIVYIDDSCTHLHFDVPPSSDPDLEYIIDGQPVGGRLRV